MFYKVDGNPQLDSRDWSMYSNILDTYCMKTCALLHFEHKNDVTIIVNLLKRVKVHSLSSGKVAATPILKSVPLQFSLLFSKLQSRFTLPRHVSPKVSHNGGDKERITAIYYFWMVDNERWREW